MTDAQRQLVTVAEQARDYFDRKTRGHLPIGMYEDIGIGRALTSALHAVRLEEQGHDDAEIKDAQFTRASREWHQKASGQ